MRPRAGLLAFVLVGSTGVLRVPVALGCSSPLLPLHTASGTAMPPAFTTIGMLPFPVVLTAFSPTEIYRAGDVTGADSATLRLLAVKGPRAGEVTLHASGSGVCGDPLTFADTGTYLRDLHVATSGSPTGDGSPARPFDRLQTAAAAARPGDRILIHEGSYPGSAYVSDLQGTAANPILVTGVPGEAPPVLGSTGVAEAIHLSLPRFLVLQDLVVDGPTGNGINIDDAGTITTPATNVVLRRVAIRNIGTGGNQDCLKLSGLDDFVVRDSTFERCGSNGSGIDMVGCHRGLIASNQFRACGSNGVQGKGGTSDVVILGNLMVDAGPRAMNLGGSTGLAFFRPPGATYEARNLHAIANVVVGSDAPVAYVGCDGCLVAGNTFWLPTRWVLRILQETDDPAFIQCRNGRFIDNVVVFDRPSISAFVNIGPSTLPATFVFANNLWFARDDPTFSGPALPTPETDAVIQQDPLLLDPANEDFHLRPGSPAAGRGICIPQLLRDFAGLCYRDPPSIGAHETP